MAEKLKIPTEVIDADWKDDVGLDYETYGTEKQEMEYVSPDNVPKESIEKIKSMDLTQKFRQRGQKIGKLFSLENI